VIKEGKGIPDFSKSDGSTFILEIPAQIKDREFVSFLNKIAERNSIVLILIDICELENMKENKIPNNIKTAEYLAGLGITERVPHERNQYMLYRKYYNAAKKRVSV
jgi:hypothetical protein